MKITFRLTALLLTAFSFVAAPANALSPEQLNNAIYQGIYDEPVQLENGKYEGDPFQEGGASRPSVTLVETLTAFGDLDGDGVEDAAIVLVEDSGGSGTFLYLAAVLNREEQPFNQATLLLGDRVNVKSIEIEDQQVLVDFIEESEKVRKRYQFSFVESGSENLGVLTFSDLEGVEWVLASPVYGEELVPDTEITAIFDGEKIGGSSGCNRYSSSVTDKKKRALEFGPSMGTRKICPEAVMAQEKAFLEALETVSRFNFSAGRLLLEHGTGQMVFAPRSVESEEGGTVSLKELDGTTWLLTELGEGQELVPDSEITVSFDEGKISGSNGCNQYSAGITEDNLGELSIGMAMGTMMACPEPVMDQENAFMAKLISVKHARLVEGQLEFVYDKGILLFTKQTTDAE